MYDYVADNCQVYTNIRLFDIRVFDFGFKRKNTEKCTLHLPEGGFRINLRGSGLSYKVYNFLHTADVKLIYQPVRRNADEMS
jgi:hypothetical protein